ncbi:MAG: PAS domain S-box protein [Acidobacteriales bacterium]|nr:PAS domain S-box protein [Terriglobales bacterium]
MAIEENPGGFIERRHAEAAMREERTRLFIESVQDYAIFMLDPQGCVATWNPGAERIKGYKTEEILGRHFSCFFSEEDVRAGRPQRELEIAKNQGRYTEENWRYRKDGTRFWAGVTITSVRDDTGRLLGFGKVTRDLTERKLSEQSLRESEQRFRLLVEGVQDYAIFMLDPQGRVTTWNVGAQRIKGYQPSEIIGQHFSRFYPEEDVRAGKPAWELSVATKEGRFEDEGWRVRRDGSRFWANVIITAVRDSDGSLLGFSKVTQDFTQRMLAQTALEESQRKLQESETSLRQLSLHLLRTQDEERRFIGREMHDSLGQYLSLLKMKLGSLAVAKPAAGDVEAGTVNQQRISECMTLLDQCMKEVRTVSYLLYPPMLEEMGLKSAIPWYLEGFSKRSGIKTTLEIADDFERMPRDVELVLFRVLQESLTNVHKHSESKTANIRLTRSGEDVVLEVTDQGKGLPGTIINQGGNAWKASTGVGLRGMSERLRQLGGVLEMSSSEAGTQLRARIPTKVPPGEGT